MFYIKDLISLEARFDPSMLPMHIHVMSDAESVYIYLTRKNDKRDLSAIIRYLLKQNTKAKTTNIDIRVTQSHINLITGNNAGECIYGKDNITGYIHPNTSKNI